MKVSFGSRGGEKLSKSQVCCFLGERQLQDEDSGIPSRKDSTLDREIDLSASRTGMKAMSVLRLCLWYHFNEDKWMKSWNHILLLVPALGCPRNIVMSRDVKHLGLSLETKALSLSM